MARCCPPDVTNLTTPLNDGERRTLDALMLLDDDWDVHVQPQLGLMQPDFVLVHDRAGVVVVEVKDWNPDCYSRSGRSIEVRDGAARQAVPHPGKQAKVYSYGAYECFALPDSNDTTERASVRTILLFPQFTDEAAKELVGQWEHVRVGGIGLLGNLAEVAREFPVREPRPDSMKKIRRELGESEFVGDQRLPLRLSRGARNIAENPTGARVRRARGPAGSGKSLGLAARAVNLAHERKTILVLCFNITLRQYLRDLTARHARDIGDPACRRRITICHVDSLISTLCTEVLGSSPGSRTDWSERVVGELSDAYDGDQPNVRRYDVILIDEGQDFRLDQWNFLREHVLNENGEILLAADCTQDIYGTSGWTEESSMLGAGFRGPWTNLKGTYRLPADLVPIVRDFADFALPGKELDLPTVEDDHPEGLAAAASTFRRWLNPDGETPGVRLANAVTQLLADHQSLAAGDIVVLTHEHANGRAAMDQLEDRGILTNHIFGRGEFDQKQRKRRFWGGAAGVKGSTIHSYKGWEARAVVVLLTENDVWPVLTYTALTRVKGDPGNRSAFITVVNEMPTLEGFKATFERDIGVDEVPRLAGQTTLDI